MKTPLRGLIAAATTPLHDDGSLDLDAVEPMVSQLIESGISGLYVCGSTGEGMSLTSDERKAVANSFVQASDGRVPVIVQVGHNSLADACELAKHAADIGADVLSATCPSYFKVTSEENLVECMATIASAAPSLPFYYYHIPALTDSRVDVLKFLQRAGDSIPNLLGLKYTTTLLHEFLSCKRFQNGRFDITWGCDEMLLGAWATGAKAAIGSTYNIAAPLYLKLIDAVESNDLETARELQFRSVKMIEVMQRCSFMGALKAIMEMQGLPGGPCRLPLVTLTDDQKSLLRRDLETIGFFDWQTR
jgi:N-acetylneuraminate lyase